MIDSFARFLRPTKLLNDPNVPKFRAVLFALTAIWTSNHVVPPEHWFPLYYQHEVDTTHLRVEFFISGPVRGIVKEGEEEVPKGFAKRICAAFLSGNSLLLPTRCDMLVFLLAPCKFGSGSWFFFTDKT